MIKLVEQMILCGRVRWLKVFRDPVHNIIHFDKDEDKLLLDLIDTEEFQRLRHIQQLGVSSFTYPGATHTRFAHSIGVAHLMNRFIDKITKLKQTDIQEDLKELWENRMLALVAALLHDIGHGPFSHTIESVTNIDHENVSIAIITGDTKIKEILEKYRSGFSKEVSDVILRTHQSKVVVRLLTSQLDVDRIDYLLRDSKMTGAGYGAFDLEWLINVLRIGIYDDQIEVGLDLDKGLSIAEDFVMARYYMYKHVYFHKATRSVEIMIKKILLRAQTLSHEGKLNLSNDLTLIMSKPSMPLSNDVIKSYLRLTDHTIWHYISEWKSCNDIELSKLCESVLTRRLFKSIKSFKDPMEFLNLASYIVEKEDVEFNQEFINNEFIMDIPSTSFYKDNYLSQKTTKTENGDEKDDEKEAREQIVLFDKEGNGFELSSISSIIEPIRNKSVEVSRLYFDEKYRKYFKGGK